MKGDLYKAIDSWGDSMEITGRGSIKQWIEMGWLNRYLDDVRKFPGNLKYG